MEARVGFSAPRGAFRRAAFRETVRIRKSLYRLYSYQSSVKVWGDAWRSSPLLVEHPEWRTTFEVTR